MKRILLYIVSFSFFISGFAQEKELLYINHDSTSPEVLRIIGDSVYTLTKDNSKPHFCKNEAGKIIYSQNSDTAWFSPYAESNIDTVIEMFDSAVKGYRIKVLSASGHDYADFWKTLIIQTVDGDDKYYRTEKSTVINRMVRDPYPKRPTGFSFLFFSERGNHLVHYDIIDSLANTFIIYVSSFLAPEVMSDGWKEWYAKCGIIGDDYVIIAGKRYDRKVIDQ